MLNLCMRVELLPNCKKLKELRYLVPRMLFTVTALHSSARSFSGLACSARMCAAAASPVVSFVNPLEADGFAEPGGWGTHEDPDALPLLCFLPGMDGSICTPFMQYPELGTVFELSCMRITDGMASRATFDQMSEACAEHVSEAVRSGRRVLLVGESFGASLAVVVSHRVRQLLQAADEGGDGDGVSGLVLVNPATSFERSALASVGPACASMTGPLLPLYPLSLLALAALVLTPVSQAPAMLSMLASKKIPATLCSEPREAYLGRVALSAFLGQRGPGLAIGELLALDFFAPDAMRFRLESWLAVGAAQANALLPTQHVTPTLTVVGDTDRLLPSLDEARRVSELLAPRGLCRGVVVVPGAGHASTLGNRLDLTAEIRRAFGGDGAELQLRPEAVTPNMPRGEAGDGWARGMLDRPFAPLDPEAYTRYNRGGELWPGKW